MRALLIITYLFFLVVPGAATEISLKNIQSNLSYPDFRLEDVIDGTSDSDNFGYTYVGKVTSEIEPVYFKKSLTEEFEYIFESIFTGKKDAIPLVIKINEIQVNEWTHLSSKTNAVSLNISIFQLLGNDEYVLLANRIINDLESEIVEESQLNLRVVSSIEKAFDFLDLNIPDRPHTMTWSALWDYVPYNDIPMPKLGKELMVYEHYSDWREQKPDQNRMYTTAKIGSITHLQTTDNEEVNDVWGFCFEDQMFINIGNKYVPFFQSNRDLLANLQGFEEYSFHRMLERNPDQGDLHNRLDNNTGTFNFRNLTDFAVNADFEDIEGGTILEFAPFGKPDEVLNVLLHNEPIIQLKKGQFVALPDFLLDSTLVVQIEGTTKRLEIELGQQTLNRVIFKKTILSSEKFTQKETERFLRNVEYKYRILF